jgi:hypothetical protein
MIESVRGWFVLKRTDNIMIYVNYGRAAVYSARMWIKRHLLAQAWFSPITVPSPLEHLSMIKPAPRAASWLQRSQQLRTQRPKI